MPSRRQKTLLSVDELIETAKFFDKQYLDLTIHSLELYDQFECSELVRKFLSKRNRWAFKVTNPHSKQVWLPALLQAFLGNRRRVGGRRVWRDVYGEQKMACAMVTFVDRDWAFADGAIRFRLAESEAKSSQRFGGHQFRRLL